MSVFIMIELAGIHFFGEEGREDLVWLGPSFQYDIVVKGLAPGTWTIQAYGERLAPLGSPCDRSPTFDVHDDSSLEWFITELPGTIDGLFSCDLVED